MSFTTGMEKWIPMILVLGKCLNKTVITTIYHKATRSEGEQAGSELVVIGRRLSVLAVGLQELFQALQRA